MSGILKILTFSFLLAGVVFARGNNADVEKSSISIKINQYYFEIGDDDDPLYKKRSHKRRKIKRKPRRGRDNR